MTLQHQETQEPPTSEVVRLAQQMYERDRAEQERQSSLAAAAEEMGIPSEYLTKAAAQLKARQIVAPTAQTRRKALPLIMAAALAMAFALMLVTLLYLSRAEVPSPPTAVEPPPPIELPLTPSAAPPTQPGPVTPPAQPYPVPLAPR